MIGGALALGFNQHGAIEVVLSVPRLERLKELKTLAGRIDDDRLAGSVLRRSLIGVLASVEAFGWQLITVGGGEAERLSVSSDQLIGGRVEVEAASKDHGGDQFRAGDKGVGVGVSVVSLREVSVVRCDDGVRLLL